MEIFEYKADYLENFPENPSSNTRVVLRVNFCCMEEEAAQE